MVPASPMLLKGSVEHSDSLAPIPDNLAPGQLFDKKNLPDMPSRFQSNHWYKIPSWLGGIWHKETQTDYYRYDYLSRQTDVTTRIQEAKSDGAWGTQKDDNGQIWQFDPAPFVTSVDGGDQTVVQIVKSSEPIECSDQQFISRSVDTQIRVDKATNVIRSVQSGEQINSYLPEGEGLIKRETSAKVFDRYGMPVVLGKSFSYEKQIALFAPQDFYQGQDMRKLFKEFLKSQK
jgi:hypothetical protein